MPSTDEMNAYWKRPLKKRPLNYKEKYSPLKRRPFNFMEKHTEMDEPQDLHIKSLQPLEKDLTRFQSTPTQHEPSGNGDLSKKPHASSHLTRVNVCDMATSAASTFESESKKYNLSDRSHSSGHTPPSVPAVTRPVTTALKSHTNENVPLSVKNRSSRPRRPKTLRNITKHGTLMSDVTEDRTLLQKSKSNHLQTPSALFDRTENYTLSERYHKNPLIHNTTSGIMNSSALLYTPETILFPALVPKVAFYPYYLYESMLMPLESPHPNIHMNPKPWPHYTNYEDNFPFLKIPRHTSKVDDESPRESADQDLQSDPFLSFLGDRYSRMPPNIPLHMLPIYHTHHTFDSRTHYPAFSHTLQDNKSGETDTQTQQPPSTVSEDAIKSPGSTISDDSGLGVEAASASNEINITGSDEDKLITDALLMTQQSSQAPTETGATNGAASVHKAKVYTCKQCYRSFSKNCSYIKHKVYHCASQKKNFSCKQCNKTFSSLGSLAIHARTHPRQFKCELCEKAFSRPWVLQCHMRTTHKGAKPY